VRAGPASDLGFYVNLALSAATAPESINGHERDFKPNRFQGILNYSCPRSARSTRPPRDFLHNRGSRRVSDNDDMLPGVAAKTLPGLPVVRKPYGAPFQRALRARPMEYGRVCCPPRCSPRRRPQSSKSVFSRAGELQWNMERPFLEPDRKFPRSTVLRWFSSRSQISFPFRWHRKPRPALCSCADLLRS